MFLTKEFKMNGSIRSLIGFLIVYGVVGGLDTNSIQLWQAIVFGVLGLAVMASGVNALNSK
jgi:hypothetical protein